MNMEILGIKRKMTNNKLFTILTSSYRKEKYIEDWAQSIIDQTYRPLSVVYVVDCSPDHTYDKIKSISEKMKKHDINIKIIENKERLYCGSSYKVALNNAEGQYFGVVDADDMLVNDAAEYVAGLYEKYTDVTWIYTQFDICDPNMNVKRRGICRPPTSGESLLSLGGKGKHMYSHWRTFSDRFPKKGKIFKEGLRSAVDKYMGYRLEEFGIGLFTDRICYKYREGVKKAISHTEKTRDTWRSVIKEAKKRRKKYKLKSYPIKVHKN